MITVMALLTARDGVSREELVDHYENHHVPLVLSRAPAPAYYARNYLPVAAERRYDAGFDVLTHMRFADQDTYRLWAELVLAADSGVAEDEARFLDRTRTRSWTVEEHRSASAPTGNGHDENAGGDHAD